MECKQCNVHAEQIKTLFKRVDEMNAIQQTLHSLDKSYALQSQLLQNIVEHNKKQDERMNRQNEINIKQNETLSNINANLSNLNTRVEKLEQGQADLAKRVDENENKHNIDLRDIEKKKFTDMLIKYGLAINGGLVVLWEILKIIKGLR